MKAINAKALTDSQTEEQKGTRWTFLTNHFHIMVCLSRDPKLRISDLSSLVGITPRAVQRILAELINDEFLKVKKEGRCNIYTIQQQKRLKHPLENQHNIGELLDILS